MKKIKFKQRVENARNAFFDDESSDANDFLSFGTEDADLQSEKITDYAPKNISLETVLKQVFLFFPGTFVLYVLSMGFTAAFIIKLTKPLGMNPRAGFVWMALLFLAAALMTWLGLGDVRKPRHVVIPASIIGVGMCFGAIAGVLMSVSNQFYRFFLNDAYAMYIFPLALIAPFLAKGWIDKDA